MIETPSLEETRSIISFKDGYFLPVNIVFNFLIGGSCFCLNCGLFLKYSKSSVNSLFLLVNFSHFAFRLNTSQRN